MESEGQIAEKEGRNKKRLFIGYDLPYDIKSYLFKITSGLKERDVDIRPVHAENIHLTLKFLGDIHVERIKKVSKALELTALSRHGFNFSLDCRLEAFPYIYRASIIYVPVKTGNDLIQDFFTSLEDNLSKIKIRKEKRRFISHITVARVKRKKDVSRLLEDIMFEKIQESRFDRVTLFESVLKSSGAEYTILDEYELK